jgi:hypothetical protein
MLSLGKIGTTINKLTCQVDMAYRSMQIKAFICCVVTNFAPLNVSDNLKNSISIPLLTILLYL